MAQKHSEVILNAVFQDRFFKKKKLLYFLKMPFSNANVLKVSAKDF